MDRLACLAELIHQRNANGDAIAKLIGRPAEIGHVGEYIASQVSKIRLEESASHKGFDGRFCEGPLAGKTVNIKWYPKREGVLDITPETLPDCYLVLAGPKTSASTSKGGTRPWVIEAVFLFDAKKLRELLKQRGVKVGSATGVAEELWRAAKVYPSGKSDLLTLTDDQRRLLTMFGGKAPGA